MSVQNAIAVYCLNGAEHRLFKEVEALKVAASEPMITGVAGRYATALFELAREEKQLDRVDGELYIFVALLDAHEGLDEALKSPATSLSEKRNVLDLVLDNAGLTGVTANFLKLVAKNNRLSGARDMVRAFNGLLDREKGEVQAQVTSATELSSDHKNEIVKTLKATLGQDVTIKTSVDPELLGGLIVKIGSKMIDNSLRTKLNNLHAALDQVS